MLTAEMPRHLEVLPVPNSRRQNRETFIRLFQGFVNEYGEAAAKKIIKHLVDQAGGLQLSIPGPGPDPLCGCSAWFRQLWRDTCKEFGRKSGRAIMNKIMGQLGGRRVRFPDYLDLYIWERNVKMHNQYCEIRSSGRSSIEALTELSINWNIHIRHVHRIVNEEDN